MSKCLKCLPALMLFALSAGAFSQYDPNHFDPENAAHWYRKAFEKLPTMRIKKQDIGELPNFSKQKLSEKEMESLKSFADTFFETRKSYNILDDYIKAEISENEAKEILSMYQTQIRYILSASALETCDWGYDLNSEDPNIVLSIHNDHMMMFDAITLIVSDSLFQANNGQTELAVSQLLSAFEIARHHNLLKSEVSWNYYSNHEKILTGINSLIPLIEDDVLLLMKIQGKLNSFMIRMKKPQQLFYNSTQYDEEYIRYQLKDIENNTEILFNASQLDEMKKQNEFVFDANDITKNFSIERVINQYQKLRYRFHEVVDMPYPQAYEKIKSIEKEYIFDIFSDTHVISSDKFNRIVAWDKNKNFYISLYLYKKFKLECYACQTAIEVALIKARTGQYPNKLPDSAPLDPFSGHSFEYTKFQDGFKLNSIVEDPLKKECHEWIITKLTD